VKHWPLFLPCYRSAIPQKTIPLRWLLWLLFFGLGVAKPLAANGAGPDLPRLVEQNVKQAGRILDICVRQIKADQLEELQGTLQQYDSLLETMAGSVREYLATHRKTPHEFKSAEIQLRKQLKRLQDLRPNLPIQLRGDLDAAIDKANGLRSNLFGELFNVTSPPHKNPKNP
jgi:hypothetical protein